MEINFSIVFLPRSQTAEDRFHFAHKFPSPHFYYMGTKISCEVNFFYPMFANSVHANIGSCSRFRMKLFFHHFVAKLP